MHARTMVCIKSHNPLPYTVDFHLHVYNELHVSHYSQNKDSDFYVCDHAFYSGDTAIAGHSVSNNGVTGDYVHANN